MSGKILIIDDERAISMAIRSVLEHHGYEVVESATASAGLREATRFGPDVVLLDLGLPDADGKDIIGQLRRLNRMAVLVLSARHQESEKVAALDAGADDYIDKPFGMEELLARIRAGVRRTGQGEGPAVFEGRGLRIDFATRSVELLGDAVHLSPKEFDILEALARNAGSVVTRRQLMLAGWGNTSTDGQYLRSYIAMLREKLEDDPSEPQLIVTEQGVGYRLAL